MEPELVKSVEEGIQDLSEVISEAYAYAEDRLNLETDAGYTVWQYLGQMLTLISEIKDLL